MAQGARSAYRRDDPREPVTSGRDCGKRAGLVDQLDLIQACHLVAAFAREGDVHLLATADVSREGGRPRRVCLVAIAPFAEGVQDRHELTTEVGHPVLV